MSESTSTRSLISQADLLSRCFDHNIVPTGNQVISDAPVGTGQPVYRELFQSAVGLAGAAQNLDGNGRYIRANAGGGDQRIQTPALPGGGPVSGFSLEAVSCRPLSLWRRSLTAAARRGNEPSGGCETRNRPRYKPTTKGQPL